MAERIRKMPGRLIYALIALASLVFMIWKGDAFGFWADEFAQVTYSCNGKTLLESLLIVDPTPPLFNVLANIWCRIGPCEQRWLLLLPQLFTALGIFLGGLWGEEMGGRRVGIWMALLMGSSRMIIALCGFEFRGYGLYMCLSALAFYLHSRLLKIGHAPAGRLGFFYGLTLFLVVHSHLFGALIFASLAAIDVVLMFFKRLPWKRILVYFCSGALFLPWFGYFLFSTKMSVLSSPSGWMPKPSWLDIPRLVAYLCGNQIISCLLFGAGCLFALCRMWRALKDKNWDSETLRKLVPYLAAAFVVLFVFAYGKIRAENKSMWVERYFSGLFPCMAAACALGMDDVSRLFEKHSRRFAAVLRVCCAAVIVTVCMGRVAMGDIPVEKFYHREATEIMYQQPDIHDEDTLVITSITAYHAGWEELYCSKRGEREPLGIRSVFRVSEEELLEYDVVYFEYGYGNTNSKQSKTRQLLEAEYTLDQEWSDVDLRRYVKK